MTSYLTIPAIATFEKDSTVTLARRSSDKILAQIDAALNQYNRPKGNTAQELKMDETLSASRLYFATDLWLKEHTKGKGKSGRKGAIYALFECTCKKLTSLTGVPLNLLPNWFTVTFGRGINMHAVELDFQNKAAKYMTPQEADKYRVQFKSGRAYQMQWWLSKTKLVAAESSRGAPGGQKTMKAGHAGYVLSMGGDFFTQKHGTTTNAKGTNIYHSTYLSGAAVRCAGTWKIENGVVLEITDASGHYRPTQDHMISALETLKTYGVNMSTLKVFIYPDETKGIDGVKFLAEAPRTSLLQRKEQFIIANDEVRRELEQLRTNAIKNMADAKLREAAEYDEMVGHFRLGAHGVDPKKKKDNEFNCTTCNKKRELWSKAKADARKLGPL
jgi:hypothetical protein